MSELSNPVDEHWNVNEQVIGASFVGARPSHDGGHMNLYIGPNNKEGNKIEIPNSVVKISDTKYGVNVSTK